MDTITVRVTNNYGTRAIYPACELSQFFATLAGTKTLTDSALALIRAQGYTVLAAPNTI